MAIPKLSEMPIGPTNYQPWEGTVIPPTPIPNDAADAQRTFTPPTPSSTPNELFSVQINNCSVRGYRFVRKTDPEQMLMFVDGSSLGNGSPTARAGFGVVSAPLEWYQPLSKRLEQDGNAQTNNRAELRAVLAALGLRWWYGEGFKKVVVASDSEYVVNGISKWMLTWRKNEWKTNTGAVIVNLDIWKKIDEKLRGMEKQGMLVQFWWIPRGLNEADAYAKAGAEKDPVVAEVREIAMMERVPSLGNDADAYVTVL
ncbi:hypothetical protein M413DRAFT_24840 [Hebeloma cylindrosporum]|uniref:ribonuclease H n=1 Tax=Hebeloma cylindrosporum TaxID=76867 RepID=A0A0C3CPH0_HEBCY|nr:hypothetical protein M413DRAFT_24840 [Hebeloma cylindrosporum h7]